MTVTAVVDLEAACIADDDAKSAVRRLFNAPLELRNGDEMYFWLESLQFSVRDTP